MGDNKISEAAVEAARDAYHEADVEPMRAAIEAALNHLQDEAVPVACVPDDAAVDELRRFANSNIGSAHGITRKQAREVLVKFANFYLHPQPAELSEVSGNSGELAPVRGRTPTDYAIEHAGYLVTAANQLLEARNELDALVIRREEEDDVDDDDMHAAQEGVGDATSVVRLAIHEFEKRRDRALAATGKQQVGEEVEDDRFPGGFANAIAYVNELEELAETLHVKVFGHESDGESGASTLLQMTIHQLDEKSEQAGEVQGSREQFEAWAKSNNYSSLKWPDGAYAEEAMQLAWKAWQHLASRQAVRIYGCCAQPEGELHTAECPNMRHLASRQPVGQERPHVPPLPDAIRDVLEWYAEGPEFTAHHDDASHAMEQAALASGDFELTSHTERGYRVYHPNGKRAERALLELDDWEKLRGTEALESFSAYAQGVDDALAGKHGAAPPAQGIDLGQFRSAVMGWRESLDQVVANTDIPGSDRRVAAGRVRECIRLLALIDGRDAGTGVGQ